MGTFLLVLALVLIVVAIPAGRLFGGEGRWRQLIAAGLIAVGIAVIVGDCVTIVPPRHEGIEIAYGKTVSNLPAGPHLVRPWSSVDSSWDATFQTLKYDGGSGDKKPLTVRLKNQTTAP